MAPSRLKTASSDLNGSSNLARMMNNLTMSNNRPPSMRDLEQRLGTFKNWLLTYISKHSLAEDGFYYTGKGDIVKCAFCNLEIGYWDKSDVPNSEHKRWNPNCPLIKGVVKSDDHSMSSFDDAKLETGLLTSLGIEAASRICYPKYAVMERRIESFMDWPISIKLKPRDLAAAGFFYMGTGDQTHCFHCGVGLKQWQENDDPWEEHALWSPKCVFICLHKGEEYISQVIAMNAAVRDNSVINSNTESQPESHLSTSLTKDRHEEGVGNVPLCGICFASERSVLYMPCRHMIACVDCATTVSICPVCRQEIRSSVKVIMS